MTKTALITGSTSGIGSALANKFAYEKYNLILVSRNADKLSLQAEFLSERYGVKVSTISEDLAKHGTAQSVYDTVRKQGLSVEVLINNAGFNECGQFLSTNLEKEIEMINLHAIFTTTMMKLFIPEMLDNGYGRVLNVGSTGSYISCPYDAVYAATKAYILSVSKGINAELRGSGVSITTLCPGSTNTEFANKAGMENTLLFRFFVMKPETVANIGYRALMKGKTSVIAGMYNKLLVFSSKFMPSIILDSITKMMLASKQ